jgi:myo-inositol-1-phosphate synthase
MPEGKLGVLIPGIGGAVSTTFITGVDRVRRGLSVPVGSLTQLGTLTRNDGNEVAIKDSLDLADLNSLVFGGWDIFPEDLYAASLKAGVLSSNDVNEVRGFLESIIPMKAVFNKDWVKNLDGNHVKTEKGCRALVNALKADIKSFKENNGVERLLF